MIASQEFKQLIGRKIGRFLIIVWPPFRESTMLNVDMSIGFEFNDIQDAMFHIHINKDDCWTPLVTETKLNEVFEWHEFQHRVDSWMEGVIDIPMQYEFFEATHEDLFRNISSKEILDIECITLKAALNPFAVKIVFPDDYIILSPTSDGSTIETSLFNQLGNLDVFRGLGELEFITGRHWLGE